MQDVQNAKQIQEWTQEGSVSHVRLYLDSDSSEVSGEFASLHTALSVMRQPSKDAQLVENGVTLALEYRDRWSLTSHGIRTLTKEYNALTRGHE